MKVTLNRINDNFLFEAKGASDVSVFIDSKTDGVAKGASPMELILMGIGGCNAIDIISILKKQRQVVDSYRIEVEGKRKEVREAKPFDSAHVTVYLEGDINPEKAKRAASLSFDKYCSVSITMEGCVKVTHEIVLNGNNI